MTFLDKLLEKHNSFCVVAENTIRKSSNNKLDDK